MLLRHPRDTGHAGPRGARGTEAPGTRHRKRTDKHTSSATTWSSVARTCTYTCPRDPTQQVDGNTSGESDCPDQTAPGVPTVPVKS